MQQIMVHYGQRWTKLIKYEFHVCSFNLIEAQDIDVNVGWPELKD